MPRFLSCFGAVALLFAAATFAAAQTPTGTGVPPAGGGGGGSGGSGPWTEVALKMESSVEFKFRTPKDGRTGGGGTLRGNWTDVSSYTLPLTGAKGGPIKFDLRAPSIVLDLDGDGTFETTSTGEVFTVVSKQGETTGKYTFRLRREYQKWFFQRACMATGDIDKTPVAFIDEDNNGRFNDVGADVARVGNGAMASYLGKLLSVKGKLYEIDVDAAGTRLRYRPFDAPTGKLDLLSGYKGKARPIMAVVQKTDGENILFDCAVKGGLVVPAGEYTLREGIIGPTRDQFCLIESGKMEKLVVKAGETTTLDWGMPGSLDFSVTKNGSIITIDGGVTAYGRAGEKYDHFESSPFSVGCTVVEEKTGKQVWFGPIANAKGYHLVTTVPWIVRLQCDSIPYLGTFQSAWQ